MSSLLLLLLAGSLLLSTTSALPVLAATYSTPLPPSQDPFYTAPDNFEREAPGTVLRVRAAPGNLTQIAGNCSATYNILYRTTDSRFRPSWAVTTLYIPLSSPRATYTASYSPVNQSGTALLSYQYPYDSADVDSSPSFAFNSGLPSNDIPLALDQGWFVSVPDYEGPLASFGLGIQAGHATLDSVRAVLSSGLGLGPDTRTALWGYSGGSSASEWAAELQVQYAPELHFSGMAVGGLTVNFTSILDAVNGELLAGLVPTTMIGIETQYPEVHDYLSKTLKPTGVLNATTFFSASNSTLIEVETRFANQDTYAYFTGGRADLHVPLIQEIFDNQFMMGYHGIPQMPVYAYHAIQDEVVSVNEVDALIDRFCNVGVNILFDRNTVGGHIAESTNGQETALAWLGTVLDGTYSSKYQTQGCTVRNVTINTDTSPI